MTDVLSSIQNRNAVCGQNTEFFNVKSRGI